MQNFIRFIICKRCQWKLLLFFFKVLSPGTGTLGQLHTWKKIEYFFFFYAMLFWYNSGNEPRFKIFKFSGTWSFTAMLGHNSLWSVNQFCDISSISSKGIEASINFFFSKCSFKWYIKKKFLYFYYSTNIAVKMFISCTDTHSSLLRFTVSDDNSEIS